MTMTDHQTIAHRLNTLLLRSAPVELDDDYAVIGTHPDDVLAHLFEEILPPCIEQVRSAVDAEEIINAARGRRKADLVAPRHRAYHATRGGIHRSWVHTRRLWTAAHALLVAALHADNARRMAEYETYRIACEQGVAVAPQQSSDRTRS